MGKLNWINANQDLPKTTQAAWSALEKSNSPPRLFLYHNVPCRLESVGSSHAVCKLTSTKLRYELARCAQWVKWVRGVKVPVYPPTYVCTNMLASPTADMPLPVLKGIDTRSHKRGYDPESRIYYAGGDNTTALDEVSP